MWLEVARLSSGTCVQALYVPRVQAQSLPGPLYVAAEKKVPPAIQWEKFPFNLAEKLSWMVHKEL